MANNLFVLSTMYNIHINVLPEITDTNKPLFYFGTTIICLLLMSPRF